MSKKKIGHQVSKLYNQDVAENNFWTQGSFTINLNQRKHEENQEIEDKINFV